MFSLKMYFINESKKKTFCLEKNTHNNFLFNSPPPPSFRIEELSVGGVVPLGRVGSKVAS